MTTEQKLREALDRIKSARAALALPPSETREEWRVTWDELIGGKWRTGHGRDSLSQYSARSLAAALAGSAIRRNVRIESRTVSASPWAEVSAGIQPSPQAECAALIGQCMDKLIDAAPFQTICAFQGHKDAPCQKCGKSWMAPDHQAPLFDPRTPR